MSLLDELLAEAIQTRIDRALAEERGRVAQREALMAQRVRQCNREFARALNARQIEIQIDGKTLARAVVGAEMKRHRSL